MKTLQNREKRLATEKQHTPNTGVKIRKPSEKTLLIAQVPQPQHSNTAQPGGEGSQKQSDRGRAFQV